MGDVVEVNVAKIIKILQVKMYGVSMLPLFISCPEVDKIAKKKITTLSIFLILKSV
jgi:hypothetical protein